jgi:hypothetical protein
MRKWLTSSGFSGAQDWARLARQARQAWSVRKLPLASCSFYSASYSANPRPTSPGAPGLVGLGGAGYCLLDSAIWLDTAKVLAASAACNAW